jgi:organic radical activating enzyme
MKLVKFQEPVFNTIQGEGALLGTPSTFIRLHGCNESCSWCDTKDSWREGSAYEEVAAAELVRRLRKLPILHNVVITGGNPMLQAEELDSLLELPLFRGRHVTIETNAYREETVHYLGRARKNLVSILWSLSPKLPTWDMSTVVAFLTNGRKAYERETYERKAQLKIVVQNEDDCLRAEELILELMDLVGPLEGHEIILQPEYGMMRKGAVEAAVRTATRMGSGGHPVAVRVIPQVQKFLAVL